MKCIDMKSVVIITTCILTAPAPVNAGIGKGIASAFEEIFSYFKSVPADDFLAGESVSELPRLTTQLVPEYKILERRRLSNQLFDEDFSVDQDYTAPQVANGSNQNPWLQLYFAQGISKAIVNDGFGAAGSAENVSDGSNEDGSNLSRFISLADKQGGISDKKSPTLEIKNYLNATIEEGRRGEDFIEIAEKLLSKSPSLAASLPKERHLQLLMERSNGSALSLIYDSIIEFSDGTEMSGSSIYKEGSSNSCDAVSVEMNVNWPEHEINAVLKYEKGLDFFTYFSELIAPASRVSQVYLIERDAKGNLLISGGDEVNGRIERGEEGAVLDAIEDQLHTYKLLDGLDVDKDVVRIRFDVPQFLEKVQYSVVSRTSLLAAVREEVFGADGIIASEGVTVYDIASGIAVYSETNEEIGKSFSYLSSLSTSSLSCPW